MFWAAAIFLFLRIAKVSLAPVQNGSSDLARAMKSGGIVGPQNLHPRLPIAVEIVPAHHGEKEAGLDCSNVEECSEGAWTDFGLGLAGLIPKDHLCQKYTPAKSCISRALSSLCIQNLDSTEKKTLLSFARIMVSWCSDNSQISTVRSESLDCDNLALYDSMSAHGCLSDVVHPHTIRGVSAAQDSDSTQDLPNLVHSFLKSYYDTSTISCLYSAIEEACGKEWAELSLGPALRQAGDSQESSSAPPGSPNHSTSLSFSLLILFLALSFSLSTRL